MIKLNGKYNNCKVYTDDIEYAFTVKGGGWGYNHKLFSTEDVNSCKAMNYIETLYAVLRR